MSEEIVNKVAKSGLVNIDLAEYAPQNEHAEFDLKDLLWQELVLKEKDFRAFVKDHDWSQYEQKNVAIYCSVDAIVPDWAFMLVASALAPFASRTYVGTPQEMVSVLFNERISKIDPEEFRDTRIVVKGCGDVKIPTSAFVELVNKLQPVVKSIMYGEPCSTVPVYKRPKA